MWTKVVNIGGTEVDLVQMTLISLFLTLIYAIVLIIVIRSDEKQKDLNAIKEQGIAVKKSIEIEFFKWNGITDIDLLIEWIDSFGLFAEDVIVFGSTSNVIKIKTLEGTSYDVPEGYYIIREARGEFYPCEGSIFLETYNIK